MTKSEFLKYCMEQELILELLDSHLDNAQYHMEQLGNEAVAEDLQRIKGEIEALYKSARFDVFLARKDFQASLDN
jgi:hypothetical protein